MHLWFVKNTTKMPLVMSTKRFFIQVKRELNKKCRRIDDNFFFAVLSLKEISHKMKIVKKNLICII